MTRTKLGLLGLCAVVVGMMAMSASAAQGATLSWLVLNASKTTATNLKAELAGEVDSPTLILHLRVSVFRILIICTGFSLKNTFIEPVEKLNEGGKVVFTGCKVFDEKEKEFKCTVKTAGAAPGTIETSEGKGLLELVEGQVLTKIEPKGGPTGSLATIRLEGAECVLPETNQVHGTLYLKDALGQATTHKVKHLVEAEPVNTKLYVGGHSAEQLEVTKILISIWIFLASAHAGLEWSGMDV
jgi:hypothetical protein